MNKKMKTFQFRKPKAPTDIQYGSKIRCRKIAKCLKQLEEELSYRYHFQNVTAHKQTTSSSECVLRKGLSLISPCAVTRDAEAITFRFPYHNAG
ncbi:hypothetical protein DOY81_000689 [Sarcophaga bullata]|nr:hypothetical protein DOY81_000689 [Sarcophaga bullata]